MVRHSNKKSSIYSFCSFICILPTSPCYLMEQYTIPWFFRKLPAVALEESYVIIGEIIKHHTLSFYLTLLAILYLHSLYTFLLTILTSRLQFLHYPIPSLHTNSEFHKHPENSLSTCALSALVWSIILKKLLQQDYMICLKCLYKRLH